MKMYLPPPGGRAKPSRRSVLQRGLIGTALLAIGGSGFLATRKSVTVAPPPEGLKALSPREFAVVVVLCERFVPRRAGFPSVDELKTATACDGIVDQLDPASRKELKQLLMLFENALTGFLFGFRAQPFTQLAIDEQEKVLEEWCHSSIALRRTGYLALRNLALAAYYGNPATWASVGYPGPLPGIHDPNAPVWRGNGTARPFSNGQFVDQPEAPDAGVTEPVDAGVAPDGGAR